MKFFARIGLAALLICLSAVFLLAEGQRATETATANLSPPGQVPIVEGERVVITAFMSLANRADNYDYDSNLFSQWYTDKTNVEFDFTTAPGSDAKTKLNLLLNSGDYPEVIFKQLSAAEMSAYGSDGLLIPLDNLIRTQGTMVNKVFAEYPVSRDVVTGIDGNIYALPSVNDCYHCAHNGRLWVYNPWLKKLGLDIPETTEEFRAVLRAFKTQDPNGNGIADEIPLAGAQEGTAMTRLDWYFMNAFTIYTREGLWVNNGTIRSCYTEPGYKRGIEYLKSLYDEGLILKEAFSTTRESLRKIGENPDDVLIGFSPGHGPGDFTKKAGPSGRWWNYLTIPPLEGPDGTRNAYYRGLYGAVSPGYFITDKAENPEVAFRAGEWFYDTETYMRSYQGPENETWEWSKPGTKGIHGEDALYKLTVTYGGADQRMNISWDQANHGARSSNFRLSEEAPNSTRIIEYLDIRNPAWADEMRDYKDYNEVFKYYLSKSNYHPYVYDQENILPPLIHEDRVYAEIADIEAVVVPYVNEMFARFITGDADLDSGWNDYLEELENMRLSRYLELMQKSYDAKYK